MAFIETKPVQATEKAGGKVIGLLNMVNMKEMTQKLEAVLAEDK